MSKIDRVILVVGYAAGRLSCYITSRAAIKIVTDTYRKAIAYKRKYKYFITEQDFDDAVQQQALIYAKLLRLDSRVHPVPKTTLFQKNK